MPLTAPFIHPHALVEHGARVGARTRVWAFVHILPGARIGDDCNICDHVFIENDVVVGNRVTIKSGIYMWDGARVEDDVHLGPHVVFTNDRYPRSRRAFTIEPIRIEAGASVGANATLLPGITIGRAAMVAAGSVVTRSVPPFTLVAGNPARPLGYVCACGRRLSQDGVEFQCGQCGARYAFDGATMSPCRS
jgi:UDP-2-acetamido-3-amino-2,3-dideoxy-glucuronate N-acetyltransferase